jgi:hypothetical protein
MAARKVAGVSGDHPEKSATGQAAKADAEKADAKVVKPVQEKVDEAVAEGLLGIEVDPTPNEHYTVSGRIADKPVPETHDEAAKAARERLTALGQDPRA